jgi:tetratricopeptide (TPR) repeat protein
MARAAAKRNKRPRQVARPQPTAASTSVKRDKALEDQLFFGRLRGHAKWAYIFLAIIFAGGFIFLGVGTGSNSGLSDVFSNIFGGSSGPSINSLQEKVAKNPKDAAALLELAQALDGKQRTDEAILAYEQYTQLRPRNVAAVSALAAAYSKKAQVDYAEIQAAANESRSGAPGQVFDPTGNSPLGQGSKDSISKAVGDAANQRYQTALLRFQQTLQGQLKAQQSIAKLQPNEPSALVAVGQTAEQIGDVGTALATYRSFLKKFPDDPIAPDVRKRLTELEKAAQPTGKSG